MFHLKNHLKMIKPFDVILVIVLLVFSFLPIAIFTYQQSMVSADAKLVAVVTVNGEEVRRITLTGNKKTETFTLHPSKIQYNIIEVAGERIRVKEDNSPDQIAVQTGWISKLGETSICLPHKVMIEIVSSAGTESDSPILSY
ncbi:NusG domain II-containing protein [Bacillaceae bacterium Marseille-Q3522]|nr:NusG domain II-containing protein [Bacillaceae bacterium Marseille-Q3522]